MLHVNAYHVTSLGAFIDWCFSWLSTGVQWPPLMSYQAYINSATEPL